MKISDEERQEVKRVLQRFCVQNRKSKEEVFYDLCFCICAPQTTFINNRKVIDSLRKASFYDKKIPVKKMHSIVKPARFYKNKTRFLIDAKEKFHEYLYPHIQEQFTPGYWHMEEREFRDWLVAAFKGLGMKASSHFCRNLGYTDVAIIDTHILKFMGLERSAINSKKKYKDTEEQFGKLAKEYNFSLAELDILIWKKYSNTSWEDFVY